MRTCSSSVNTNTNSDFGGNYMKLTIKVNFYSVYDQWSCLQSILCLECCMFTVIKSIHSISFLGMQFKN